jgi:hypothetical protein
VRLEQPAQQLHDHVAGGRHVRHRNQLFALIDHEQQPTTGCARHHAATTNSMPAGSETYTPGIIVSTLRASASIGEVPGLTTGSTSQPASGFSLGSTPHARR